jgi:hypothetical protein
MEQPSEADARAPREAAGTLLSELAPQERAALVLKQVFDFSVEEIAAALTTSVSAVKAALYRDRSKLNAPLAESARRARRSVQRARRALPQQRLSLLVGDYWANESGLAAARPPRGNAWPCRRYAAPVRNFTIPCGAFSAQKQSA